MYKVEKNIDTMELLDYLEVAPEGTVVEDEDGKSYFKLSCGRWTDGECNTFGNIDLALEIEGNFKPFTLNHYRLYVGNNMAYGVWTAISTDPEYSANMIKELYTNYLLNIVGVSAKDRDMNVHVTMSSSAPIKYMLMLSEAFDEIGVKFDMEIMD